MDDSFNLMQPNDDANCSDGFCNVYADAYIQPNYSSDTYNTNNVPYAQNIPFDVDALNAQINLGRYINSGEDDDFWLVYIQLAYQGDVEQDCDPNSGPCLAGGTPGSIFSVDDVTSEAQVPDGYQGSLSFLEGMRDFDNYSGRDFRVRSVPHEIGHQFGLRGDDSAQNFGLMNPSGDLRFVDRHINAMRWRRKSPGVPR